MKTNPAINVSSTQQSIGVIRCPRCTSTVNPEDDFCPFCNELLKSKVCSGCQATIPATEDPCHFCGHLESGEVTVIDTGNGELLRKCPKCQALVQAEDNTCPDCHQVLKRKQCPNCEAYIPASEDPCHFCAALNSEVTLSSLPIRVEGKKFGIRAGAYLVDLIVDFISGAAVSFMVGTLIGGILLIAMAITGQQFTIDEQVNQCLNIVVSVVLFTIYFTTFEWLYGATPGKLILRMRVVKEDGTPCDLKAAFVRALLRYVDGLFVGIPAYMTMQKPLYQRIGDKSAKTIVVGSREAIIQKPRDWWWFLIAAGIYLFISAIANVFIIVGMIQGTTHEPVAFKACQVTDIGGIDDLSFNATAWKGVQDAMEMLSIEGKYLESRQHSDYDKNIKTFIDEGCDIIITVGFLLGDATKAEAEANPNQKFSIVDYAYDPAIPNVLGQVFARDQAGFMAGYLAAGLTRTGKIGTFGGIQIPTVTGFMDGFALGAQEYNKRHDANVEVLGWDPDAQTGLFVGNFESTDDGRTMGETLMDEGADIIMPVAGPVGLGTAAVVKEHGNAYIVGVEYDWYIHLPDYRQIILTSILENMDITTFNAIQAAMDGTFVGGVTVGNLENGGVSLASFHELDSMVPAELKAELEQIKADIVAGKIVIMSNP